MRASRLLHMLLMLQNRGRLTSAQLASELGVARRTILRDLDALTEAGLPVVVYPGHRGGIELGFNYRTRLTGLAADEAEAIGVLLSRPSPELAALGMGDAARQACRKLLESLPDQTREHAALGAARFPLAAASGHDEDVRLPALARAVREHRVVRLRAYQPDEREVHPVALRWDGSDWCLEDDRSPGAPIDRGAWGNINISARRFTHRTRAR